MNAKEAAIYGYEVNSKCTFEGMHEQPCSRNAMTFV